MFRETAMFGPNWRDREFDRVEELSIELKDLIAMLGHVGGMPLQPEHRVPTAEDDHDLDSFTQ